MKMLRRTNLNISLKEVIERIDFGIRRLQEPDVTKGEQSKILMIISALSRTKSEQMKEERAVYESTR